MPENINQKLKSVVLGCCQSAWRQVARRARIVGQCSNIIRCVMLTYQIIYFQRLIARDGRKFIQEFIDAHANAKEVIKCFDSDTSTGKNRCSVLNFGVD